MANNRIEVNRPKDINVDLSPYDLANDIWSAGRNVNFNSFRTNKGLGFEKVMPDLNIQPIFNISWTDFSLPYWFYANETSIYITEGATQLDVSRVSGGAYSATLANGWTGTNFNGALIMNNTVDAPQFYNVSTNKMEDLTGWPANYKCAVVRSFKNYAVALDITKDTGERFQNMVKWSDSVDAGGVPQSWDETDPTTQAGENVIPDSEGKIVDALALRDTLFIYKNDSVWGMQFVGGQFIFSFRKIFGQGTGCIARDAVTEFDNKHFVVGIDDVYIHDGNTNRSVITSRFKKLLFGQVNPAYIDKIKVVSDRLNKENIIYFPSIESTTGLADRAISYNWETDTWVEREISEISHIASGVVDPQEDNSWDGNESTWNNSTF